MKYLLAILIILSLFLPRTTLAKKAPPLTEKQVIAQWERLGSLNAKLYRVGYKYVVICNQKAKTKQCRNYKRSIKRIKTEIQLTKKLLNYDSRV